MPPRRTPTLGKLADPPAHYVEEFKTNGACTNQLEPDDGDSIEGVWIAVEQPRPMWQ